MNGCSRMRLQKMAILCEACNRKWHDCLIRECPKKPGHRICYYCCKRCKWHYDALAGRGCRAFDEMKADTVNDGRNAEDEAD